MYDNIDLENLQPPAKFSPKTGPLMFHNHNPNGVGQHLGQHSGSMGSQNGG